MEHCYLSLAEIADNMMKYTRKEVDKNLDFSSSVIDGINSIREKLNEQFNLTCELFENYTKKTIKKSDDIENCIDQTRSQLINHHIKRLEEALLALGDAPIEDNKAVTHDPILLPKIIYKTEFPPPPIAIPALAIEIIIVVKADEDCNKAVKAIPIINKTKGLFIDANILTIDSEFLKSAIELDIKKSFYWSCYWNVSNCNYSIKWRDYCYGCWVC